MWNKDNSDWWYYKLSRHTSAWIALYPNTEHWNIFASEAGGVIKSVAAGEGTVEQMMTDSLNAAAELGFGV